MSDPFSRKFPEILPISPDFEENTPQSLKALMAAMILRAVRDLYEERLEVRKSAYKWLFEDWGKGSYVLSAHQCFQVLNYDIESFRKELKAKGLDQRLDGESARLMRLKYSDGVLIENPESLRYKRNNS